MSRLARQAAPFITWAICLLGSSLPAQMQGTVLPSLHHTAWTLDNGGVGIVADLSEDTDGFLWVSNVKGTFRFDGVRFEEVNTIVPGRTHRNEVYRVWPSKRGGLWLGTSDEGLVFYRNGKITPTPWSRCKSKYSPVTLQEDSHGALWITDSSRLYHLENSNCTLVEAEWSYAGGPLLATYLDSHGTLWMKSAKGTLFYKTVDSDTFQKDAAGYSFTLTAYFTEATDGSVWMSDMPGGFRKVWPIDAKSSKSLLPPKFEIGPILLDRNGSLWMVLRDGIHRCNFAEFLKANIRDRPKLLKASHEASMSASSDVVWCMLQSREGGVWLGTGAGLEEFRANRVQSFALPHGHQYQYALAPADDGGIWTAQWSSPLMKLDRGGTVTRSLRVKTAVDYLKRQRDGTIWVGEALSTEMLRGHNGKFEKVKTPFSTLDSVLGIAMDRHGDLWVSFALNGIYRLHAGKWEAQNPRLGLIGRGYLPWDTDDQGNFWFATSKSVIKLDGDKVSRYSLPEKLQRRYAIAMSAYAGHIWVGGEGGVAVLTGGSFYPLLDSTKKESLSISGIVERAEGDLWMSSLDGVLRISKGEMAHWWKDPSYHVHPEKFEALDGLRGSTGEQQGATIIMGTDGRLWTATNRGVFSIDPANVDLMRNQVAPSVFVTELIAGGETYPGSNALQLPAHTQNLQVNFSAPSLLIPERVRFRYKLDGIDKNWQDAGTRRDASYTNVSPGHHRFNVVACNNDGLWNEQGATFDFEIIPAWYQTRWFYALISVVGTICLWGIYRLRLWQIRRVISAGFDERLAERTRVARDLHDTFMQTVQASKMAVDEARRSSLDPGRVRRDLDLEALSGWLGQATEEGRAALNSLRAASADECGLEEALRRAIEECQARGLSNCSFFVTGKIKKTYPVVRDELYRIAYEAILNACAHSQANQLDVYLIYANDLTIRIVDDGIGIDPLIVEKGRDGHFGLRGMHERVSRIKGKLTIVSASETGTEITVSVPGRIVFQKNVLEPADGMIYFLKAVRRVIATRLKFWRWTNAGR